MRTLHSWSVKRSGARMTISGIEARPLGDRVVRISNVNTVACDRQGPFCTVDGGEQIRLGTVLR